MEVVTFSDDEGAALSLSKGTYEGAEFHIPSHWGDKLPYILDEAKDFTWSKEDVWICSFPKSGLHWSWEIVGMLLSGKAEPVDISQRHLMPERIDNLDILNQRQPRMINTHMAQPYVPQKVFDVGSKVIHVVRNPKDVAVSYYYYIRGMESFNYSGTFSGFMGLYMKGVFRGPLHGSWLDYELDWWKACKDNPNVLFITYEELKQDHLGGIKRIAKFLGKDYSEEFYAEVAAKCSFDFMKKDVVGKEDSWRWVNSRGNIFRKGAVGDWKRYFTVADSECFDAIYKERVKDHPEFAAMIQMEPIEDTNS